MKRTDRMFAIGVDLQTRRILPAEDFAARYETSVRENSTREAEALLVADVRFELEAESARCDAETRGRRRAERG
jgi:hypothetical protein